ncbi:MAG: UbiA family prenyltransferase, partial [Chitinophagaceae bacterium]
MEKESFDRQGLGDGGLLQRGRSGWGRIKDYVLLIKPSLTIMVVFSSVISLMLTQGWESYVNKWKMVLLLFAGGMLVTGSANAINQVVEKDTDSRMKRT